MCPGVFLIQSGGARFNAQPAPRSHRVAGVDHQIQQRLLDLMRVGLHVRERGVELDAALDIFPAHSFQQRAHPLHNLVNVHDPGLQHLCAAEGHSW